MDIAGVFRIMSNYDEAVKTVKVELSPFKKNLFYLPQWKPFKIEEKYIFFFNLKSSFRSQDTLIFVSTFGHLEKTALLER